MKGSIVIVPNGFEQQHVFQACCGPPEKAFVRKKSHIYRDGAVGHVFYIETQYSPEKWSAMWTPCDSDWYPRYDDTVHIAVWAHVDGLVHIIEKRSEYTGCEVHELRQTQETEEGIRI